MTLIDSSNNHERTAHLICYFLVIPSFQWQCLDLQKKHGVYLMLLFSSIVKQIKLTLDKFSQFSQRLSLSLTQM